MQSLKLLQNSIFDFFKSSRDLKSELILVCRTVVGIHSFTLPIWGFAATPHQLRAGALA